MDENYAIYHFYLYFLQPSPGNLIIFSKNVWKIKQKCGNTGVTKTYAMIKIQIIKIKTSDSKKTDLFLLWF